MITCRDTGMDLGTHRYPRVPIRDPIRSLSGSLPDRSLSASLPGRSLAARSLSGTLPGRSGSGGSPLGGRTSVPPSGLTSTLPHHTSLTGNLNQKNKGKVMAFDSHIFVASNITLLKYDFDF